MIRLPKEDGAWWMALTCWVAGWGAALRLAWQPLALAAAVVSLFGAAQSVRTARRLWGPDRKSAWKLLPHVFLAMLVAAASAVVLVRRAPDFAAWAALSLPGALYAPLLLSGAERRPAARVLAVAALTAVAPATYAAATGGFGTIAVVLWVAIGGYFLLGSIFVTARFRASAFALWLVRILSTIAVAGAGVCSSRGGIHWILSGAFAILAVRAWAHRPGRRPLDPKRVGHVELAYGAAAAALVLLAIWWR